MKFISFRSLITITTGLLYLISEFLPHINFHNIISLLIILLLISFYNSLINSLKIIVLLLLIISFMLFFYTGNLEKLFYAMDTNINLLMLFIFVPLLSIPIQTGFYLKYAETLFNYFINTTNKLSLYLSVFTLSLSSVMNVGAIPLLYQLTNIKMFEEYTSFKIKAISRGIAMAFLWSPYFISMAVVLTHFNVQWSDLFIIGFIMSILNITTSLFCRKTKNNIIKSNNSNIPIKKAALKLSQLLLIFIVMTIIIIIFEYITSFEILTIITIVVIATTIFWSLLLQSPKKFADSLLKYSTEKIPSMGNELTIFLVAGILGSALLDANINEIIDSIFQNIGITHILILIPVIIIVLVLLSFIGIHPVITMSVLGVSLSSSDTFINDHLLLSSGILVGWSITIMLSPFSSVNLILSNLTNSKSVIDGLKYNWKYSIAYGLFLYGIICILYLILY